MSSPLQTSGNISFGDINVALGLSRTTIRTLKTDNDNAYVGSTPYTNRVRPKVSHWYGYYRATAWRGINVTCITTNGPTTPGTPTYTFTDTFSGDDDTLVWTKSTSDNTTISLYEIYITRNGSYVKTLYTDTADSLYWYPDNDFSGTTRGVAFNHNSIARQYGIGNYMFKIRAKDALGRYSSFSANSSIYYWDPETPSAYPTSLYYTSIDITTFTLNWVESTYVGAGVTGYKIYKNGVYLSTVGVVTSSNITGLTANTSYNFTVVAIMGTTATSPSSDTLAVLTAPDLLRFVEISQVTSSTTRTYVWQLLGTTDTLCTITLGAYGVYQLYNITSFDKSLIGSAYTTFINSRTLTNWSYGGPIKPSATWNSSNNQLTFTMDYGHSVSVPTMTIPAYSPVNNATYYWRW